jgi:hypothetical protein
MGIYNFQFNEYKQQTNEKDFILTDACGSICGL